MNRWLPAKFPLALRHPDMIDMLAGLQCSSLCDAGHGSRAQAQSQLSLLVSGTPMTAFDQSNSGCPNLVGSGHTSDDHEHKATAMVPLRRSHPECFRRRCVAMSETDEIICPVPTRRHPALCLGAAPKRCTKGLLHPRLDLSAGIIGPVRLRLEPHYTWYGIRPHSNTRA